MYLQLLGYDAVIVKDVMWMIHTDKIVTADDTVVILSIRNSTKELARSARIAKKIGAKVITCCCKNTNGSRTVFRYCIDRSFRTDYKYERTDRVLADPAYDYFQNDH